MTDDFRGRRIIVTGGTRGLGAEAVRFLAGQGATILAHGRSSNDTILHPNVEFIYLDFAVQGNVEKFTSRALEFDPDSILHCLGGGFKRSSDFIVRDDFLYLLNLNFMVSLEINNILIPKMLQVKRGWIIHFSSIATRELTASLGYTCVKSLIAPYVKHLGRKLVSEEVFMSGVTLGALSGGDGALDRLEAERNDVYNTLIVQRRPTNRASPTAELMPFIKLLLSKYGKVHASNMICLDEAEGIRI